MKNEKFDFVIMESFNAQYYEDSEIAQVLYYGDPWIIISQINNEFVLHICKHPRKDCWQMTYKDAIEALERIQQEVRACKQLES